VTVYFADSSFSALVKKQPFAIEQSGRATVHLTAAPKQRRLIAAARLTGLENALIDGDRCFAGGPQPIDAIEAQMSWFCSYTFDIIANRPASQTAYEGSIPFALA
jgi:hypothetical protein